MHIYKIYNTLLKNFTLKWVASINPTFKQNFVVFVS